MECRLSCRIFFLDLFIYLRLLWVFVAVRGLSLVAAGGDSSLVAVCRLLKAVVSLAAQHGLQGAQVQ